MLNIPVLNLFFVRVWIKKKKDMNKMWTRVVAVILAALLLWWLFWAILADEDINEMEMQDTEIVE